MIGRVATGEELRGLMRLWPHGVSVLSVDADGDRMGVTVSSLVSLSLEPPLIGLSASSSSGRPGATTAGPVRPAGTRESGLCTERLLQPKRGRRPPHQPARLSVAGRRARAG